MRTIVRLRKVGCYDGWLQLSKALRKGVSRRDYLDWPGGGISIMLVEVGDSPTVGSIIPTVSRSRELAEL